MYFTPANNMMDELPCNPDIEDEISSLVSDEEDGILAILLIEPKAYQMTPFPLTISNESLYPLPTMLSQPSFYTITDGCLRDIDMLCYCGKFVNCFCLEVEFLHRGVLIHLQLSS